jgi:hypothetical protein
MRRKTMDKRDCCPPCENPDYNIYPWLDYSKAFVLWQRLCRLYSPEEALMKGTVFPELYKPYKQTKM